MDYAQLHVLPCIFRTKVGLKSKFPTEKKSSFNGTHAIFKPKLNTNITGFTEVKYGFFLYCYIAYINGIAANSHENNTLIFEIKFNYTKYHFD